jgi:hypothetical protein
MADLNAVCFLADCDRKAAIHVMHAEDGRAGEAFCCWDHLLSYAQSRLVVVGGSSTGWPKTPIDSRERHTIAARALGPWNGCADGPAENYWG